MPAAVPIIIAAVGSAFTVEGGVIVFTSVSAMLVGAGLALAGELLSKSFAKTPDIPVFQRQMQDRSVTVRQPIAARRIIYGKARLGGVYSFIHVTGSNNEYIHLVITLSGKRLAGIDNLYFDGELIPITNNASTGRTAGHVNMYVNLGDANQAAIPELVAAVPTKWTTAHRQRGCAHVYLKLKYDQNIFPNGIPNITFDTRGYDGVYDPRTGTSAYTANAALCQADYLNDPIFGLNAAYTSEIVDADLIEAANICDEDVSLAAGGTEKRYELNGVIDSSNTPKVIIQQLLTTSSGSAISMGNLWVIHAGAYRAPLIDLDENDLAGPIKFQTRHSRQDLFNSVQGTFVSPDNDWQPADFPPVSIAAYVSEDNNEEIWKDVQLPFTISSTASQRIVRNQIEINRRQINGVIQCKSNAWQIAAGDNFRLTLAKYGWVNKIFKAGAVRLAQTGTPPALVVEMDIAETDSTVWGWTTGDEAAPTPANTTTLPDPFNFPAPSSLVWSSTDLYSSGTGTLSWAAANSAFVNEYQVEYLPPGAAVYLEHAPVTETQAEFNNLSTGSWTFRVRANGNVGTHSVWVYLSQSIVIPTVPNVTGLVLVDGDTATTFTGGSAKFTWAATTLSDRPGNDGAGPWFDAYKVEIVKGNTVVRTEYPKNNQYEYTFEKNTADGGPARDFDIYVYVKGDQDQLSLTPATLSVSNPAPTMAGYTPSASATFKGIDLDWSAWSTTDADIEKFKIYLDTNATPTALIKELPSVTHHYLAANLDVGTNYKVRIVPADAFGDGISSGIASGTPLILAGTDVDAATSGTITMSDSDGSTAAELSTVYDRVVDSGSLTYTLVGAEKFIRYEFGLKDYIDKIILHVGSTPCQVYIRYSVDGTNWNYLEAQSTHDLTTTGELVVGDSSTAPTNYWQTVAGLNVAIFPARSVAKYCELVMVGSYTTTIFELVFARIVVAEEIAVNYLSAISTQTGILYGNYDGTAKTGFMLDGISGHADFYDTTIRVMSWADVTSAAGDAPAANADSTNPVLQAGTTITAGGVTLNGGSGKFIVKDAAGVIRVQMGALS